MNELRKENHTSPNGKWETMARPTGLLRYIPSGTFFVRVRYKGKLLGPKTLKTQDYRKAVECMPACIQKLKIAHDACATTNIDTECDPTTWRVAGGIFRQESENYFTLGCIQHGALKTRLSFLNKIEYFWPSIVETPVRDIRPNMALRFMAEAKSGTGRFAKRKRPAEFISRKGVFFGGPECPSAFDRLLWVARSVADRAIAQDKANGLPEFENPFASIPRFPVPSAVPPLPSEAQLELILKEVLENACFRTTEESRFRSWAGIKFLAMSGLRIVELVGGHKPKHEGDIPHPGLLWEDIRDDLAEPYIRATCEKKRKKENWRKERIIPFFGGAQGEMAELVRELRTRWYNGDPKSKVFQNVATTRGFNSYLQRACRNLQLMDGNGRSLHLTEHDLRHVFATRCVEANVTWKALAEWLGHEDGGLLAAKTYSHLRDEHSFEMASRLKKGN